LLEAGFLLGRALLAQGLAREAVAELQAVTRAAEVPPGAHLALGLALREREQLPEALQSFTHAVDHDPNPDEALYWAGRTAAQLGRHADAVPRLGRAAWPRPAPAPPGRPTRSCGSAARCIASAASPEARAAFTAYLQLAGDKATCPRRGREADARALRGKGFTRRRRLAHTPGPRRSGRAV
jgi:tetratricopeptide (TPR) repeat protein